MMRSHRLGWMARCAAPVRRHVWLVNAFMVPVAASSENIMSRTMSGVAGNRMYRFHDSENTEKESTSTILEQEA